MQPADEQLLWQQLIHKVTPELLLMNRDGKVFTVSITSLAIDADAMTMEYLNMKNDTRHTSKLLSENSIAGK